MIKTPTSKPKIVILFILCIFFVVSLLTSSKPRPVLSENEFAFGPTPEHGQLGGLEGVYYRKGSSLIERLDEWGCKTDGWDHCVTYELIRFYSDGVVLETPVATDNVMSDKDLLKLLKWFNRGTEELSKGKYFTSGRKIWFSTSIHYAVDNTTVTVDSSGFILGDMLILDSYSHYNNANFGKIVFTKLRGNP